MQTATAKAKIPLTDDELKHLVKHHLEAWHENGKIKVAFITNCKHNPCPTNDICAVSVCPYKPCP